MTDEPLIDNYHSFMAETWDGTEDDIPMGMLRKADGSVIMIALALEPEQAYQVFLSMVVDEEATEAVFTLDRYAQPGQGTKYDDVLAGHCFDRALGKNPWRPFVIEYRKEPRHFEPVDYDNAFWNETLSRELDATMRNMIGNMLGMVMQ
jgi:hypothetical protein